MMIHRTAIVHPDAQLEVDVQIGAYSVIGPGVSIGKGTVIGDHVVVVCNTSLGQENKVYSHAVIGSDGQDLSYRGQPTHLLIGDRNIIREYVTINRGVHGAALTQLGSDCMLMTGVHIAHDCRVGDRVIMANLATLGGHITIEDRVVIGGLGGLHQFVRVGTMAMVGGKAGVTQDVPPYCLVQGPPPAVVRGLNLVGLKRSGISAEALNALKAAFRLVFRRGMGKEHALAEISEAVEQTPEVINFVGFLQAESKRGLCKGEQPSQPSLKISSPDETLPLKQQVSRLVREELKSISEQQGQASDDLAGVS